MTSKLCISAFQKRSPAGQHCCMSTQRFHPYMEYVTSSRSFMELAAGLYKNQTNHRATISGLPVTVISQNTLWLANITAQNCMEGVTGNCSAPCRSK